MNIDTHKLNEALKVALASCGLPITDINVTTKHSERDISGEWSKFGLTGFPKLEETLEIKMVVKHAHYE